MQRDRVVDGRAERTRAPGATIAIATPIATRQPTADPRQHCGRQGRRDRDHRPGDGGDQDARPEQLAAHDRRRLHRPCLQELEMLKILADVDADHLRRHQNREDRGGNRERAERGGRSLAPGGRGDDRQGEEDDGDPRAGRACRRLAASASPPSTRTRLRDARSARSVQPAARAAIADGLLRLCLTTAPAGGVVRRIVKRLVALQHPQRRWPRAPPPTRRAP